MKKNQKPAEHGFTLIELLLVTVIIGILLAVIVPRAWRANVEAKYSLVRQGATELAAHANKWAQQQIEAQDDDSTATLSNYFHTLAQVSGSAHRSWVAEETGARLDNWASATGRRNVVGRRMGGNDAPVLGLTAVETIIPPERQLRNPFNGANIFSATNNPDGAGSVVPGALACGRGTESNQYYFALVFQGTDSTSTSLEAASMPSAGTVFHAGQNVVNMDGLRSGIFIARVPQ